MSRDSADAPFGAGDEDLSLPIEMYFAREPERVDDRFESAVLARVNRAAPLIGRRERRVISLSRAVIALGVVALVGVAAAVDRLGLAPWNPDPASKPVARLVQSASSASSGAAEPIRHVVQARDALEGTLREAAAEHAAWVTMVAVSSPGRAEVGSWISASEARVASTAGPYLSAVEPECPARVHRERSGMIVFADGFCVPGLASSSSDDLRWPSLDGLASSVVLLDGLPAASLPTDVTPAWYAGPRSTPGATARQPRVAGEAR